MFINSVDAIAREQRKDLLRQAEQERLIKTLRPQQNSSKQLMYTLAVIPALFLLVFILTACNTASAGTEVAPAVQPAEEAVAGGEENQIMAPVVNTPYPKITIIAADHTFAAPAQVEAGLVSVTLENQGQTPHHVQLARLNDGIGIAQFQEALQAGPEAFGLVTWAGGVAAVDPDSSQTVSVNLQPGTYLLLCFIPDHEGTPHMAFGQMSSMEVVEPVAKYAAPQTNSVLKMLDFSYILPNNIKAGQQVWEIVNRGEQPHEIALIKLAKGKTMADVQAFMAAPEGVPPFSNVGGLQGIDPGETGWLHLNLTPGEYVALCHIPDPASGHAHSELGMVVPFSVN